MIPPIHFAAETVLVPNNVGARLIVDIADADRVLSRLWRVDRGDDFYAFYASFGDKKVYLSRFILGARRGELVDHVNGDRLDNRRINLRVATHAENSRNRKKTFAGATSRFKGVCKNTHGPRLWKASIRTMGKTIHLGRYDCEEEAARAYDAAAREKFGAFGRFNFPLPGEQPALSPTGGR